MTQAHPKQFEIRFRGLVENGSEAILGYADTEEEAQDLVDLISTEFPKWYDAHYVKVVAN